MKLGPAMVCAHNRLYVLLLVLPQAQTEPTSSPHYLRALSIGFPNFLQTLVPYPLFKQWQWIPIIEASIKASYYSVESLVVSVEFI
ncbi:hypothetical protein HanXRQr2_Chr17g0802121 [Helianthus annuus]|uniref:Uncharacterized protein n=1 Tax=Helianthus annuus TaxID=4232 RepID=A0A9K3DGX9_HELAN|nr:hypothetical protein HanXRQr2_Chr17g0802121 [Helianthus annuus]KAJ0813106.1 hypothetical protein HanPSC8_Chr17g0769701 [Helianthus annuus]